MNRDPAKFFVERWQFTLSCAILLALLGINAFLTIPRSEDPHTPGQKVIVRAALPGASPLEMEQLVAKPLEDAIESLDDVVKVQSANMDGSSLLQIEFSWSADPDRKYDEVVREVNALRETLPRGIALLQVQRIRATEAAIVQVALTSDILPMRRLEKVAHRLRDEVNRVPGVRQATWWGAPQSEVRVSLDLAKLTQLRLTPNAVVQALSSAGDESPIGPLHAGNRRFNVKSGGFHSTISTVRATPVAAVGGDVVRVGDIATVAWATAEAQYRTSFNGQRALFVTATQKDDADVMTVTAGIRRALQSFQKTLPGSVRLRMAFFQADNVDQRLSRLYRDFGVALALVLLTLLPLGLRAGMIVMLSIPLSLLAGLAGLQAFGYGLNQLSIAAFVIALGLLVDDSIVVVENVARHLREGEERKQAAVNGTRQIFLAVIGCSATLMLAFIPLMALPGGPGAFIRTLPFTILCTVAGSLLVSLTIVPFLASRLLSRHEAAEGNAFLKALAGGIRRAYRPLLRRALLAPWRALAAVLLLCLLTIPMLAAMGTSLFPAAEIPQFLIKIELPNGAALDETGQALHHVESRLRAVPEVAWFASNLGRGNPQVYYNASQHEPAANYAEVLVCLKQWQPNASARLLDRMRVAFSKIPGARISVTPFQNGTPVEAPIVVRIIGQKLEVLKTLAGEVEAIMRGTPGTREVKDPAGTDRIDLELGIDQAKAAALGVPAGTAPEIVRLALSGVETARLRDADGDDYPVVVRLPMQDRNDLSALQQIYIPTANGQAAPLTAIARPVLQYGSARIDRYNRERAISVTAFVKGGYLASAVTGSIAERLNSSLRVPPGYRISFGGEAEEQSQNFAGMGGRNACRHPRHSCRTGAGVRSLSYNAGRCRHHSPWCVRGCRRSVSHGKSAVFHCRRWNRCVDRHRNQEFHLAGRFHRTAPPDRNGIGKRHRARRRSPVSSGFPDIRYGDCRPVAARL